MAAQSLTAAQIDDLAHKLRALRDALMTITNAGPDMPPAAIRSVAFLAGRLCDELLMVVS
jgi:hypothetical protein